MATGKAITIFLIDGNPDGLLTCELSNWTGKAVKIPRLMLKDSAKRLELNKTGVYFLFGRDEANPDATAVYIGEAEEVYKRLIQHQKLDFWTEAVVFISKDENLNKAHIKFLEYSLHEMAEKANRYSIKNANTPTRPSISESERAVMLEFMDNMKVLINTMGYKLFEPLTEAREDKENQYFIKATRGADSKAVVTNEGIVVTKGSTIATSLVPSISPSLIAFRQKLIDRGVIVQKKDKLQFTQDYLFASPSTAAAIVMGRNANGRIEWKDKDGKTLKENEEL